jgi:hypothetical protein
MRYKGNAEARRSQRRVCDERITISAVKDLGQLRLYIS